MVEVPAEHHDRLLVLQEHIEKEQRFKPHLNDLVRLAIEDLLKQYDLWPPGEGE